ncbi:MAG: sugar ABC transporter permease [Gemmatimonadaceae bacterium]|nr:sugar ABC transporter permease [Gemmatimonadaceae bacterium]
MSRRTVWWLWLTTLLWAATTVALGWNALHGFDHAARSREALARAAASRDAVPTPQWPVQIGDAELATLRQEERPLIVHDPDGVELITAPVKDADDWDIVGAVGVYSQWRAHAVGVGIPATAVLLAVAVLLVGVRDARRATPRTAAMAAVVLFGAGAAATAAILSRASGALASRVSVPTALERMALRPPSLSFVALTLAITAAAGALAIAAVAWQAHNADRPARVRETLGAWAFIAPSLAHLLVFTIAPAAFLVWISVHDWDLLATTRPFVGLAHFREIGGDPLFWRAVANGLVYALYVPVTMLAALGAALVLDQPLRGIKVLRVVVFLPYVASTVAIALVWQWLLHRDFGLLNAALTAVHLPRVDWLGNPATALPALMLVSAWCQLGYMMVVYLGGLQAIPASLLEAARLDGASAWQRFRMVRWPLLRPVSAYLLLTGIIWSFHGFTLVYVMTEGGPAHATDVLVYRIYQTAWEFRRFDVAAAMSVVLCLLLLALTALQWKAVKGEPADA